MPLVHARLDPTRLDRAVRRRQKTVDYLSIISKDPDAISSPDKAIKAPLDYALESALDDKLIDIYPLPEGKSISGSLLLAAIKNSKCGRDLVTRLRTSRDGSAERTINMRGMRAPQKRELSVAVLTCPFSTRKLVKAVVDRKKITSEVLTEVVRSENGQAIEWSEKKSTWTWLMGHYPQPETYWAVLVAALEAGDAKLAELIY